MDSQIPGERPTTSLSSTTEHEVREISAPQSTNTHTQTRAV